MPFQLKNPSASRYDLKPDQMEYFMPILEMVRGYGKAHIIREAIIVQCIRDYGGGDATEVIERFCARGMMSLDRLQSLLDGQEPLEFEKPKAMNEMPGRMRTRNDNQSKTAGAFLDDLRLDPNAPLPIAKPSEAKRRLPDGVMNKDMMESWMKNNRPHELDSVDEFFKYLGVATGHGPLWELRIRVSQ